jgi:hypothetical protein
MSSKKCFSCRDSRVFHLKSKVLDVNRLVPCALCNGKFKLDRFILIRLQWVFVEKCPNLLIKRFVYFVKLEKDPGIQALFSGWYRE